MHDGQRYPFMIADPVVGEASFRPYLPLALLHNGRRIETHGLLDTGAAVNVLPYRLGADLGAQWDKQRATLQLTGNLANFEARLLLLDLVVGGFSPVRMAFAWTEAENVPLILGQVNFFLEFDACFYRSELAFELSQKQSHQA